MSKKKNEKIATPIVNKNDIGKTVKRRRHPFVNTMLFFTLLSSIIYFVVTLLYKENDLNMLSILINILLLFLFTIFFIFSSLSNNSNKKTATFMSAFILTMYNVVGIVTTMGLIVIPTYNKVEDFTNKSLTEVVSWASKNNITLHQEYEYSDMISEYHIISQNMKPGTNIKNIKSLTVAISDGASPDKEVVVPDMTTWDSERALNFINENYLTNVSVEFVKSDKVKDTVIEQSKSGNMKRSDALKLTFSLGEEELSEVKMIDLTNKTKFEAEFYLKQHQINYEIKNAFSNKIKRGNVSKQSIRAGDTVKVNDEDHKVIVTISKGKKIKVPNLKDMSVTEITNWIIKNRLKLEFADQYDEKIKDNKVISANYKTGDIVEQGTLIHVIISKGKLVMPKFSSLSEFYEWADKYSIHYEEKYEFNNDVAAGEVIKYSHKTGDVIKNNDTIIITISDGKKREVPNLVGLSKSDIISKLKKLDLGYSFVYKNSSSVSKDKAISQSISAGSNVSSGTTITVTLSNGKKEVTQKKEVSTKPSNSNTTSGSSGSSNSGSNNTNNSGDKTPACEVKTYTVSGSIRNIFNSYSSYDAVSSALYSFFSSNYPNVKLSVVGVGDTGMSSGSYVGGIGPGSSVTSCNGVVYTIKIAK